MVFQIVQKLTAANRIFSNSESVDNKSFESFLIVLYHVRAFFKTARENT